MVSGKYPPGQYCLGDIVLEPARIPQSTPSNWFCFLATDMNMETKLSNIKCANRNLGLDIHDSSVST